MLIQSLKHLRRGGNGKRKDGRTVGFLGGNDRIEMVDKQRVPLSTLCLLRVCWKCFWGYGSMSS